jgi:hypothetical protein
MQCAAMRIMCTPTRPADAENTRSGFSLALQINSARDRRAQRLEPWRLPCVGALALYGGPLYILWL